MCTELLRISNPVIGSKVTIFNKHNFMETRPPPGTICDVLNLFVFLNMHLFINNDSQILCIYLVITLILVVHIENNPLGRLFNVNNQN